MKYRCLYYTLNWLRGKFFSLLELFLMKMAIQQKNVFNLNRWFFRIQFNRCSLFYMQWVDWKFHLQILFVKFVFSSYQISHQHPRASLQKDAELVLSYDKIESINFDILPENLGQALQLLWTDKGLQKCFLRAREYYLNDSAP